MPETTAAIQIAALDATVKAKFEGFDRRAASQETTQKEATAAIDRLTAATHTGFADIGRELSAAGERLGGHAEKIRALETARETDRRAGITAGGATGITAAAVLEGFLHFIGFGSH